MISLLVGRKMTNSEIPAEFLVFNGKKPKVSGYLQENNKEYSLISAL